MKQIDLVYFDAGGGHRAAAAALRAAIHARKPGWNVRLVHLFHVLDPKSRFRSITGMAPETYYNKRLATGWTLGLAPELKVLQGMIRLGHEWLVESLRGHWLRTEPDLVVSLIPNFNRALFQSLAQALPGVPYVTVMTDLADFPPHFWIEPDQEQELICGTPHAVQQALDAGCAPERVHEVSGMVLRADFYEVRDVDRAAERKRLGLDPERPTGLVMFGGQGSSTMLRLARELDDTQLILMCGHNAKLAGHLNSLVASAPRCAVGFTADVPRYMQLADFFIGKPGPGSLSEAVHMRLPVIVLHNAWTMPQERYNASWVRQNGVGLVVSKIAQIRPAVAELAARLLEFREATARLDNRSVFEIVDRLDAILAGRGHTVPAAVERAVAAIA